MKTILIALAFALPSFTYAQNIEIVCGGEVETTLNGYTGGGARNWKRETKLEVTFDQRQKSISRAFSSNFTFSVCFLDKAALANCSCGVTEDVIGCSFKHESLGHSMFSINRKTGGGLMLETATYKSGDSNSYEAHRRAEISCQVFDKNKF
jgi:hypothetical protein